MAAKKITSFDLGTNSIGWSVIEEENDKFKSILGAGSRIIPMDPDFMKEFETGNKITKNAERRLKRGSRKLLDRYQLRRKNLIEALKVLELLPEEFTPKNAGKLFKELTKKPEALKKLPDDWYVYFLRQKALREAVTPSEFGRILYHLNQRRGYKDIGEIMEEASENGMDHEQKDYFKSFEIVRIAKVQKTESLKKKKPEYEVTLEDGRTGSTTVSTLAEMAGEEHELEIRIKIKKDGSENIEFALPDKTDWLTKLEVLKKQITSSGLHVGEYFWKKISENRHFRIRQNLVFREKYIEEFRAIWAKQEMLMPVLKSEEAKQKVLNKIIPNNASEQAKWQNKSLREFFERYIIYYQRPLKSQVSKIGNCRFEPFIYVLDKEKGEYIKIPNRTVPSSAPLSEEFRVWQTIQNVRMKDIYNKAYPLTEEQKVILYEKLNETLELSATQIQKLIQADTKKYPEISHAGGIKGNATKVRISNALKKAGVTVTDILKENTDLHRIWHILYSVNENDFRTKALMKWYGMDEQAAKIIAALRFEKKHGSLSARAIKKLLPLMKSGKYFNQEEIANPVLEKISHILNGEYNPEISDELRSHFEQCNAASDFSGLMYWEAATLVYGSHSDMSPEDQYEKPEDIEIVPRNSLRNPVVEQVVNETLHIMKDIWKTYGKPDEIHVELSREMKMNADERKKMTKAMGEQERRNKDYADILRNEFNIAKPSRTDINRYRLYKDQKTCCMYSGKTIQKAQLFNGETDIDHIIPRQRYFDDSYQNKVLCFRKENEEKSNLTSYEYMQQKGTQAWENFVQRVDDLYRNKNIGARKKRNLLADKIPTDFVTRQLNDTRYISKWIVSEFAKICPGKVFTTGGAITDYLKEDWKLNKVFKEVQFDRFRRLEKLTGKQLIHEVKNNGYHDWQIEGWDKRIDHRHHALDAIVVACTKPAMIQALNNLSQTLEKGESIKNKGNRHFEIPSTDFREQVKKTLEGIIVSHKSRKRLVSKSRNQYRVFDSQTGTYVTKKQIKSPLSVRGPLHDEQPLGITVEYAKMEIRKALAAIRENPGILEEHVKDKKLFAVDWQVAKIKEKLSESNNDIALVIKNLRKSPLTDLRGEPLEYVSVFSRKYVKTRNLDITITKNQIDLIIDRGLRQEIRQHLAANGDDPKKAFNAEGLHEFNRNRSIPLFKVRCKLDDTEVGEAENREPIERDSEDNRKLFIEKGNNFCFVIYEHMETGKREYGIVSFYDAVALKTSGQPIVTPKDGYRFFTLSHNELVYVLRPEETFETINFEDIKKSNSRVYRVVKFSGKQIYFAPQTLADIVKSELISFQELGTQKGLEFINTDNPRTKISERCIKVDIDRLGKVKPIAW